MQNVRNLAFDSNVFFGSTLLSQDTLYRVQETELPGITVNHINENTKVGVINIQGSIAEYSPISITLILDEDLLIWKEIIKIMQKYHTPGTNLCEPLVGDSWIEIRDNRNNYKFKLELKNTYIKSIGNVTYKTTGDNEIITVKIELVYDYFEVI